MSEVKVVLLHGGVEMIGEFEPFLGGHRVKRPVRILAIPLPQQGPKGISVGVIMHLIPLCPSVIDTEILLKATDYVNSPMEPTKQALDSYLRMTTGIITGAQ